MNIPIKKILQFAKPFFLPLLLAIFPSLFHYGNNLTILLLPSLYRMLIFNTLVALVFYILFLILKRPPVEAANATFVFLIFFNVYGILYDYLLSLDVFQVEHYALFPFFVLLGVYASWLVSKIGTSYSVTFWNNLTLIVGILVIFNTIKIIPAEIEKNGKTEATTSASVIMDANLATQEYPDIYFIIFDEFSGFEPMREYWHNQEVNDFVGFLKSKGFFVAEQSHSSSIVTLHQLATRFNYEEYPCCAIKYRQMYYYPSISNNKVMGYLKSKGYSVVIISGLTKAYPAMTPIAADYILTDKDSGLFFDDFWGLVANNTMLCAFKRLYSENKKFVARKNWILFVTNKLGRLNEVSSPKFVYVHLLLPHMPFMFDKNGRLISSDVEAYQNWDNYLGNYQFAMSIAQKMVENILSNSDPNRPPVIILQSDHGARNLISSEDESLKLKDFPEAYKTSILYALYMSGYDMSTLPQDIHPINTFPIVFNYLFDAKIPLK